MKTNPEEIVSILREEIQGYDTRVRRDETGTVLEVGDGIATVYGLDRAVYGELVELDTGVKGMVMDLARDSVGVVLLGSDILLAGDTLFAGSCGRTDFPGGSSRKILRSLARLGALGGNPAVYPGHMESSTLDRERRSNPFMLQALAGDRP